MHPEDRRYSREHEWARDEGDGTVLVGITDYAQEKLGDIVFVELPAVGSGFERDQKLGEVESVKSVSDILLAVSGEVVEGERGGGGQPGDRERGPARQRLAGEAPARPSRPRWTTCFRPPTTSLCWRAWNSAA